MSEPPRSEPPKGDPQAEAERRLRIMLASEAKAQREALGRIKVGFYGCVTLLVAAFLILLFFF
jgi:hypothetical protein